MAGIEKGSSDRLTSPIPHLLNADLATMQEAVALFGFKEFTVEGYSTDDVLARLQGR